MSEQIPDSIYECDELIFDEGVYVINWAVVWDIIRAESWARARYYNSKTVKQDGGRRFVGGDLPDAWHIKVNYKKTLADTNLNANRNYVDFRKLAYSSSSIQPLTEVLSEYLREQEWYRKQFRKSSKKAFKKTHNSIKSAVSYGKIGLGVSKFVAEASSDILLILSPHSKAAWAYKGLAVAAGGGIKGGITWAETGSFEKGAIRGGISTAVGLVPFGVGKTGVNPNSVSGVIVSMGAGGTATATGDGTYAYITGGDVKKAAVIGMFKGMSMGVSRQAVGVSLSTFADDALLEIAKVSVPVSLSHTTITQGGELMWNATEAKNIREKTVQFKLKGSRINVTPNFNYNDCFTDAMINGKCSIGTSYFIEEYALIDVTQESR